MSPGRGKERLGRGLSALLGEHLEADAPEASEIRTVQVRAIVPNPFQPRREFKPEELEDLKRSIAENGLLQPLVVRPAPGARGKFELVAGERRFRSVSQLGWTQVPVVVREVEDTTLLVLALVENIQRQALNPLEEAEGYRTLVDQFDLSQEEVARAVGKSRSAIANSMRLLQLPPSVRRLLESGELSAGHARALLGVEDAVKAADLGRRAAREGWSVREVESRVRDGAEPRKTRNNPRGKEEDPVLQALQDALRARFGARVRLKVGRSESGSIQIPFSDAQEFARVFEALTGSSPEEWVD